MTNEEYLITSYFAVGIICIGMSVLIYALLKNSFAKTVSLYSGSKLPIILKRLFFIGILFPALMGFFSVSYRDCKGSYKSIIADKTYLIAKNQAQLSAATWYLVFALVIWSLVVALILMIGKKKTDHAG